MYVYTDSEPKEPRGSNLKLATTASRYRSMFDFKQENAIRVNLFELEVQTRGHPGNRGRRESAQIVRCGKKSGRSSMPRNPLRRSQTPAFSQRHAQLSRPCRS